MNTWRLLIDQPKSGWDNMATDEAILNICSQEFSQATLRLYEWKNPTLSIGCFQRSDKIIEHCLKSDISYVRRITGGRAVLHADEIAYSIVCGENEPLFAEGISGAYRIISRCLLEALREAGVNAEMQDASLPQSASIRGCKMQDAEKISCFHSPSRYEIIIDNKKLIGSAQRRFKRAFLQHGSILFGINRELIIQLFGEESLQRMACLGFYSSIKKNEFKAILINKIKEGLNVQLTAGNITNHERYLREKLISVKESECQRVKELIAPPTRLGN
ncbi:MAG: lipoate--protein ligase family protein [Deltaproteobacteria bacterium]|nr:lipoate--protein ligase family protein [Deltaproteobacteria bacterium]